MPDSDGNLLNQISQATGLPSDLVTGELKALIKKAGLTEDNLTLEDLREVLAEYLQDVLIDAKKCLADEDL